MTLGGPLRLAVAATLIWIPLVMGASAQAAAQTAEQQAGQGTEGLAAAAAPVVPQQVRYAGKLATRGGETVEAVFRIYASQEGGEPLWTETQQLAVGPDGSYTVLLGSVSQGGLPQTVFSGGAARWLGVSVERAAEPDRVLLASVPYAMKSADAEALAGHAAADFVTQEQLAQLATLAIPSAQSVASAQSGQGGNPAPAAQPNGSGPVSGLGTANTVPLWTGANTQGNSLITQSGSLTGINLNGVTPIDTLDVGGNLNMRGNLFFPPIAAATPTVGARSNIFQFEAASWSTVSNSSVIQSFKLSALSTGNNTANPGATFNLLFNSAAGATTSILSIASTGVISFAPTQTFPGTIKSVAATSPVTAATTSGAVTLGLNTAALETTLNSFYAQLNATNTFIGNQSITGGLTATGALAGASSSVSGLATATGGFLSNGAVTVTPSTLATSSAAVNSPLLELGASAYSGTLVAPQAQNFAWQSVASGNGTASPTANLALLFGAGTTAPSATGLSVAANGNITFAPSQTFPGAGTITGITTTSPLTGSGASGSVALGLNTGALLPAITPPLETTFNTLYPQLATSNAFALGASFGGPIFASALGSGVNAVTATGTTGAYGISATSDTGNAGSFGNASAPDATIYSTNSANFNGSYIPVALNTTATGTDSIGTYGDGTLAGLAGASSTGIGVWGVSGSISSLPTLTTTGVLGDAGAPAFGNAGVLGFTAGSQSTSYTYEVGRSGVAGVWGDTTGNPASSLDFSVGVLGTTDAYDGYGGAFIANSGVTDALFAKNLNSGTGIYGESLGVGVTSAKGTGGTGVEGFTPSPAEGQAGILGNAYQLSTTYSTVEALGPVGFVAGVWGDSGEVNDGTATYTAGVVGTGDDITAGLFENNSGHPTLAVTNLDSSGTTGLFKNADGLDIGRHLRHRQRRRPELHRAGEVPGDHRQRYAQGGDLLRAIAGELDGRFRHRRR